MLRPLASGSTGQPRAPPPSAAAMLNGCGPARPPRRGGGRDDYNSRQPPRPPSAAKRGGGVAAARGRWETGRWRRRMGAPGAVWGGREGASWREEAGDRSGETWGEVSAAGGVVGREAPRLISVSLP